LGLPVDPELEQELLVVLISNLKQSIDDLLSLLKPNGSHIYLLVHHSAAQMFMQDSGSQPVISGKLLQGSPLENILIILH
jgi:hypothetical protein